MFFRSGEVFRCIGTGLSERQGGGELSVLMSGRPTWVLPIADVSNADVYAIRQDMGVSEGEWWDRVEREGLLVYEQAAGESVADDRAFTYYTSVHVPGWTRGDLEETLGSWLDLVLVSSFAQWSPNGREPHELAELAKHGIDVDSATFWVVLARTEEQLLEVGRLLASVDPDASFLTDNYEGHRARDVVVYLDQGWDLQSRRPQDGVGSQ